MQPGEGTSAALFLCLRKTGGSGVGALLLRRIADAFPAIRRQLPELRMIMVAGPRIGPVSLPRHAGMEIRDYVPDLNKHLAACDIALVQGGLTTCMELTAACVPFLYFPLRNHFEQNVHVRHRLGRYGAGHVMDYDTANPDEIAAAIIGRLGQPVAYRPVETDGGRRAAKVLEEFV